MSGLLGQARTVIQGCAGRGALLCTAGGVPVMRLEREAAYNNWRNTFMDLQKQASKDDRFAELSTNVAQNNSNISLNRYYNVLPFDQTRVVVTHDSKEIYINANTVKVPRAGRKYILTQGPLDCTVDDFWLMCQQQNSDTIIMLCNCVEMQKEKSAKYWPEKVGDTLLLGESRVGLGLEVCLDSEEDRGHYITRTLTLTDQVSGEERQIKHFHYVDWPDFNVPKSPDCFLEFLLAVRRSGCFSESRCVGPPVVHCSAGIGRSGTLCLVDSCLVLAESGTELSVKLVLETLQGMRTQRFGLIQTQEQLRFSVDALVLGVKRLQREEVRPSSCGKRLKTRDDDGDGEGGEDGEGGHTGQEGGEPKKRKNSES